MYIKFLIIKKIYQNFFFIFSKKKFWKKNSLKKWIFFWYIFLSPHQAQKFRISIKKDHLVFFAHESTFVCQSVGMSVRSFNQLPYTRHYNPRILGPMDHQKSNFSLISDTLSVGGCWGQPMSFFWKLVDETQIPKTAEATRNHNSIKFFYLSTPQSWFTYISSLWYTL